jgi:uncharacterized protein (DUF58 family)
LIREVLFFRPQHTGTCIREALRVLNRVLHRRAIVFLISDFIDHDFEQALHYTGRRHDLIAMPIRDPREQQLPKVGLLQIEDAETGQYVLLDTSSKRLRREFAGRATQQRENLLQMCRSARVDVIEVSTDGGHLEALVRFFRLRQRRLRSI